MCWTLLNLKIVSVHKMLSDKAAKTLQLPCFVGLDFFLAVPPVFFISHIVHYVYETV